MARPSERMRLKDKIVSDVSKAIKSIQEQHFYLSRDVAVSSDPTCGHLVLGNGDRYCHRLCDRLDHALLHGLREVTHGYWQLVKRLCHKAVIKEVELLTNVTTDLGRGRAWMYGALNEGLLESYLRLLAENHRLVKRHYNKDALLLDTDKMNVLLTLTSGLDFVTFKLDYDLPYLDLSPSPPRTQLGCKEEEVDGDIGKLQASFVARSNTPSDSDSISLTSLDIQTPDDWKALMARDAVSLVSAASDDMEVRSSPLSLTIRPDLLHQNNNLTPGATSDSHSVSSLSSTSDMDLHRRLENIVPSDNRDLVPLSQDSLEVIRIQSKKKRRKVKQTAVLGGQRKSGEVVLPSQLVQPKCDPSSSETRAESTTLTTLDRPGTLEGVCVDVAEEDSSGQAAGCEESVRTQCPVLDGSLCHPRKADVEGAEESVRTADTACGQDDPLEEADSYVSVIERKIAQMCGQPHQAVGVESFQCPSELVSPVPPLVSIDNVESGSSTVGVNPDGKHSIHSLITKQQEEEGEEIDSVDCPVSPEVDGRELSEVEQEDYYDFYSKDSSLIQEGRALEDSEKTACRNNLQQSSYLQDYMDFVLKAPDDHSQPQEPVSWPRPVPTVTDYSLSPDNNTKLQVMLEIFQSEDEIFVEMFACRENQTEGDLSVVFVLISDQRLYLLHHQGKARKFSVQSVTTLTDIIFISTGLYDQTLNIESRDRSRQKQRLWLTPGHQDLTKAIVASLTAVVQEANNSANTLSVRAKFSVGSDVPLQTIGLRKYISGELNCEVQAVTIADYSLVVWEDPSSQSRSSELRSKEGTLLLRTPDPVKGFVWKPVYAVLRGGLLSISASKSDPRPHSYLSLGGDQCVGCRLTDVGERQHCLELVQAVGGSWFLSASSADEILEWRRTLCLAVSQGVEDVGGLVGCVPCCCLQTMHRLILCHEDLDTKFFRTLGRANLEDVTGVAVDATGLPYCLVEFESQEVGVTSSRWVFHFASSSDMNRFTTSLATGWQNIFQVPLVLTYIQDVTLQRHCQAHSAVLTKALELH